MTVSLEDLGMALQVLCSDFERELEEQARDDVDAAAKVCEEQLHETSPKKTGKYADGWTTSDDSEGAYGYAVRVHNAKKPGLAHLLSKGHALRNGGFKAGDGHVAAAADAGIAELERRLASG